MNIEIGRETGAVMASGIEMTAAIGIEARLETRLGTRVCRAETETESGTKSGTVTGARTGTGNETATGSGTEEETMIEDGGGVGNGDRITFYACIFTGQVYNYLVII